MGKLVVCVVAMLTSFAAHADFEGADVPIAVKYLPCDSAPRILVQFADGSKNIWYPANGGDNSKAFLAVALAAKASGSPMYYYGHGSGTAVTTYCIAVSARAVTMFGAS